MATRTVLSLLAIPFAFVTACAPELYKRDGINPHHKRQTLPNIIENTRGWTFDLAEEWNTLHPDWGYCMNGTQQSPIAYESQMGLSQKHRPTFKYPDSIMGDFDNWDFGPQFTYDDSGVKPTLHWEENGKDETAYFKSWHTHAPGEHTIDGWRAKAEMHYVHYTADGTPRAVVGFLIDRTPTSRGSKFFSQLPVSPDFRNNETIADLEINLNIALNEVLEYTEFFTYQGSLTTPPCKEGLRWFVAKEVIYISDVQMQQLLDKSTFSSRPTQPIWLHNVNA